MTTQVSKKKKLVIDVMEFVVVIDKNYFMGD